MINDRLTLYLIDNKYINIQYKNNLLFNHIFGKIDTIAFSSSQIWEGAMNECLLFFSCRKRFKIIHAKYLSVLPSRLFLDIRPILMQGYYYLIKLCKKTFKGFIWIQGFQIMVVCNSV